MVKETAPVQTKVRSTKRSGKRYQQEIRGCLGVFGTATSKKKTLNLSKNEYVLCFVTIIIE